MKGTDFKYGQPERPEQEKDSKYREAPTELVLMAKDVMEKNHAYLKPCKILYLVYEEEMEYRGKKVPGRVYKIHDREKTKIDYDLEMVISEPIFEQLAEENHEEAALDFLFCFITIGSEAGTWTTQDPDFYGFYSNIDRYGMWDRGLKNLEKRMNQLKLQFDGNTREFAREMGVEKELDMLEQN